MVLRTGSRRRLPLRSGSKAQQTRRLLATSTSVLAAPSLLLCSGLANAQESAPQSVALEQIIVTASRRSESITDVPFNISAYGGEQLARGNITSVTALTEQVPNFNIQDSGKGQASSSVPIIRGLNASNPVSGSSRFFQSPVGFYLGNAPLTGYFPLFDMQRVEVLRGPQGTLYGAGSLSGAVRMIPVAPTIGEFTGLATSSISSSSHSDDESYNFGGALSVPLGETFAFRVSAYHEYNGGVTDQHDVFRRENGDYLRGAPILADPNDVAFSSGVLHDVKDADWDRTTSARAVFLWQPSSATSVQLSYDFADLDGNGGPGDNNVFGGGPFPIDPRLELAPTREYESSRPGLDPFDRRSHLAALDVSQDLGFATVSTTLALGRTKADSIVDATETFLGTPILVYYTGVPGTPRFVVQSSAVEDERTTTEEIRLVSNTEGAFSYIAGVFFQQQRKIMDLNVYDPGAAAQSEAASGGDTTPVAAGGGYVPTDEFGRAYTALTTQRFKDYSAYGELTWNVTDAWSLTGGARVFHQAFTQDFDAESFFFFYTLDERNEDEIDSQIFKASTSYQFTPDVQGYLTWSQGYRRGGANSLALEGAIREPAELVTYDPDRTDNFELGLKATVGGMFLSGNVFYVDWDKPQIDLLTPYNLANAVINASSATSKGFELEAFGPLGDSGFSILAGVAYAKARLSEDFMRPAGGGTGDIVPDAIVGTKGDSLPGAPDWSGSMTLSYGTNLGARMTLDASVGMDFRSSTVNTLNDSATRSAAYELYRATLSLGFDDWTAELFATNLTNKRAVISYSQQSEDNQAFLGDWGRGFLTNRPREIGLRITRSW